MVDKPSNQNSDVYRSGTKCEGQKYDIYFAQVSEVQENKFAKGRLHFKS